MKGCIEACYLHRVGKLNFAAFDAGDVVRLVQGCERRETTEFCKYDVVDLDGRTVAWTPMNDPMPHSREPCLRNVVKKCRYRPPQGCRGPFCLCDGEAALVKNLAMAGAKDEMG
jgi:hypothetical protein